MYVQKCSSYQNENSLNFLENINQIFLSSFWAKRKGCVSFQEKGRLKKNSSSGEKLFGEHQTNFSGKTGAKSETWYFSQKNIVPSVFLSSKKRFVELQPENFSTQLEYNIKVVFFLRKKTPPNFSSHQVKNRLNSSKNINQIFSNEVGAKLLSFNSREKVLSKCSSHQF